MAGVSAGASVWFESALSDSAGLGLQPVSGIGLVAGSVNLLLALLLGNALPTLTALGGAMLVGLLAYGVSLVLFVVGLRELGTARTGAYFSTG